MLFHDDVVAHRKPQSGAFAGRLGREERVEHLFLHVHRDAGAIVANSDFDMFAAILGAGNDGRFKSGAALGLAFGHGIKAV